jgi:hypothetical protein
VEPNPDAEIACGPGPEIARPALGFRDYATRRQERIAEFANPHSVRERDRLH